jgi:hypothetical protein
MMEGDHAGGSRLQQLVVAITVGGRLEGEFQRLGDLQDGGALRLGRPMQEVHHVGAGDDLLIERRPAGLAHSLQSVKRHHREDVDELAVTVGMAGQPLAEPRHRRR